MPGWSVLREVRSIILRSSSRSQVHDPRHPSRLYIMIMIFVVLPANYRDILEMCIVLLTPGALAPAILRLVSHYYLP